MYKGRKEFRWTDRVRNEEVLHRVKEERKFLHTTRRKADWIGHIFFKNGLLKHVIGVKIEGTIEVKEDEKEDVSIYWMTLRKQRILEI
jgi:hypothetical protein